MVGNNSVVILAVSWTETCIGLFFFGLRFLSNWKFVGRFRWDFAVAGLTVVSGLFSIRSFDSMALANEWRF